MNQLFNFFNDLSTKTMEDTLLYLILFNLVKEDLAEFVIDAVENLAVNFSRF